MQDSGFAGKTARSFQRKDAFERAKAMVINMQHKTSDMVRAALCTALIAALAQLTIPMPSGVPVTLQTFAVAFAGYCQRPRHGLLTISAYLLLGLAGVPVVSGFGGGASVLAGPTGGFLVGFVPMILLCSLAAAAPRLWQGALLSLLGLFCCHALGTAWYCIAAKSEPLAAFLLVSAPYLLKDVASLLAAWLLCRALGRALPSVLPARHADEGRVPEDTGCKEG